MAYSISIFKENIINHKLNNISTIKNGFINKNYSLILYNNLIQCLENESIFTNNQINNVINSLEQINNEY